MTLKKCSIYDADSRPDILIGRSWPKGLRPHPLAGMSGYLGNPFVMDEDGGHDGTREDVLAEYKEWLWRGTNVVNGREPKDYRRFALTELPGHYRWGCYCKPENCHGGILLAWLKRQLQIKKARQRWPQRKVAEMAEANQSGNGIMPQNGQDKHENT